MLARQGVSAQVPSELAKGLHDKANNARSQMNRRETIRTSKHVQRTPTLLCIRLQGQTNHLSIETEHLQGMRGSVDWRGQRSMLPSHIGRRVLQCHARFLVVSTSQDATMPVNKRQGFCLDSRILATCESASIHQQRQCERGGRRLL